jgi:Tol biopolymer transport system component
LHDNLQDSVRDSTHHTSIDFRKPRLIERFDFIIGCIIAVLLFAIFATIAAGDRAGVSVAITLSAHDVHTTTPIRVTFGEPMDTASVEANFSINPPVKGTFSWSGAQLTFRPDEAFDDSQHYTVTIQAGAKSQQGRNLTQEVRQEFETVASRVVYLAPAVPGEEQTAATNLWTVDPNVPFAGTQITFSHSGILPDFSVSPDGTRIAYAEAGDHRTADLYLYSLDDGTTQRVTQCVEAQCQAPEWSPDGTRLVYERTELSSTLSDNDRGVPRPWIVNLADLSTVPFLPSSQLLGKAPRWSPNGNAISVYDQVVHAIIVYDVTTGDRKIIPSEENDSGTFDPKGTKLIFPDLQQSQDGFYTTLAIADLAVPQNGLKPLKSKDDAVVEDRSAAWRPDGSQIALTRRYFGVTQGAQVYLIDPVNDDEQPLVYDPQYNHGAVSWDAKGDQLVMQRYPLFGDNPVPGIWVYDIQTKSLRHIAKNGYLPKWLP